MINDPRDASLRTGGQAPPQAPAMQSVQFQKGQMTPQAPAQPYQAVATADEGRGMVPPQAPQVAPMNFGETSNPMTDTGAGQVPPQAPKLPTPSLPVTKKR
jgi:hypothetical protein